MQKLMCLPESSEAYWPIIGLRTLRVAKLCRDPAGQSECFLCVVYLILLLLSQPQPFSDWLTNINCPAVFIARQCSRTYTVICIYKLDSWANSNRDTGALAIQALMSGHQQLPTTQTTIRSWAIDQSIAPTALS